MKKFLLLLFVMAATTTYAQDVDSYIELMRSEVKTDKKTIITEAMECTEAEAAVFWPVYRNYEFELDKQADARLALIKDYAENFDTMTEAKAKELIEKALSQ